MVKKNQRLVELNDGIRLLVTDRGTPDYGTRFTADVYSADGRYCGSLGSNDNDHGATTLDSMDDFATEARLEQFAAEFDQCILKALSAAAGR